MQLALKAKEDEVAAAKAEAAKVAKARDAAVKRSKQLEEARAAAESDRDALKLGAQRIVAEFDAVLLAKMELAKVGTRVKQLEKARASGAERS